MKTNKTIIEEVYGIVDKQCVPIQIVKERRFLWWKQVQVLFRQRNIQLSGNIYNTNEIRWINKKNVIINKNEK